LSLNIAIEAIINNLYLFNSLKRYNDNNMCSDLDSGIASNKIISKKHHYLPVFYLNGFCNNDGLFYVFDKVKDDFLPKCSPESKFFINNLNNYIHNGKPIFSYEESYFNKIDNLGSKALKEIIESDISIEDNIPFKTKIDFIWFLTNLFWRAPSANKTFVDIIQKEGLNNKYFGFYKGSPKNKLSDEDIPDIKKQIIDDDEIKKVFRTIVPSINSNINEMWRLLQVWNIFKIDNSHLITGDFPFVNNNSNLCLENIFDNFIFPISNNRLLMFGKDYPMFIDSIVLSFINLSIFNSANRFVCCHKKELILDVIKHRNELSKNNKTESINVILFKYLKIQSNFKSFDDYKKFVSGTNYKI